MITLGKFKILWNSLIGYIYKCFVDMRLLRIPDLKGTHEVVVSVTSYGRRVSNEVVYYTLVSLLRQSEQPQRIILWLAEDEWNDEILPKKLLKLKDKGIEIRYCKDICSYKKLIPTLKICPNTNVMTVDDDVIYRTDMIQEVWKKHLEKPSAIVCMNASEPIVENGIPKYYSKWQKIQNNAIGMTIFPVGVGGILYPSGSLHSDVMREELFMKICPMADDIWFWFCGLRNSTEKIYIKKKYQDLSFDALYQYFHKGSALTHTNRFEHANDKQFKDLFEFYDIKLLNGRLINC